MHEWSAICNKFTRREERIGVQFAKFKIEVEAQTLHAALQQPTSEPRYSAQQLTCLHVNNTRAESLSHQ
jgi:hypothetical protein